MKVGLKSLIAVATLAMVGSATGAFAAGGGGYPFHTSMGGLTVDYSVGAQPGDTRATGIIETNRPVAEVTLDFVALDSAGKIVERNHEIVHWGFNENAPKSFTMRLPDDPRAQRYELRIADYVPLDEKTG